MKTPEISTITPAQLSDMERSVAIKTYNNDEKHSNTTGPELEEEPKIKIRRKRKK